MKRLTALISGTVQGVGYRLYVQRYARDLGLSGYAENTDDERVEVVAEGHQEDLERLLHQLKRGPKHAVVESVDAQWAESSGLSGFHIY
ncbi:acylphosphatase [Deinococcus psychrotolerans]|uniref:acylphosphatase n=2 Tax=Deinococcus TaxID=1298 RepID=A0A553UZP6_9DEIO|nr:MULTISPECIES: acylphosphatase [Deinococcus]AZI41818.1 acylphosphatase [Deinococcus psychrotolerans]TSA85668.1 acylphosphatase [Deinococcus detaillensis]